MTLRVYLTALGCRLNQAELESLAAQLRAAGHRLVATAAEADWVVVNSCTVTARADADSRALLRRLGRAAPSARIAVTGCWSAVRPDEAAAQPGVALVVPNSDKAELPALLTGARTTAAPSSPRVPIPGPRRRARAFLKVQDGCDRACAYCLTTVARGPGRSTPLERVLADARAAEEGGAGELLLCGVQLSGWGADLPGRPWLGDLLDAVLEGTRGVRVRLSSVEPWGLPGELFERWESPRLQPSLHLPLQSGCDATLARMGRANRRGDAEAVIAAARGRIPGLALSADVMVGFPGESEAELEESLGWLVGLKLADSHVFGLSPRPGTPAATMPGQHAREVIRQRRARALAALAAQHRAFREGLLGRALPVLWTRTRPVEGGEGWRLEGVCPQGLPVRARAAEDRWGCRDRVRLRALEGGVLLASL
jgi:threonylcarbamoyladenosine tRNA methylthiotransferase MtaB